MRHRFSAHGMSIAVAVALAAPALVLGAGPARAQAAAPQAADGWTPSRTLWGDPDLQGQWTNLREAQTPFERPDALAERGITDPRNPEVLAEQQALVDDPEARQAFEARSTRRAPRAPAPARCTGTRTWLRSEAACGSSWIRRTPLAARMRRMASTMVALPTPGPPVMTTAWP